ncbi:MAG: hypothetical protein E2576_14395 [Alcaligenaceae bacterium]|nr:hypothetical protein [Alcaligenaceae bacterium SAGV5]MPS50430.1 hypothetical protein [Alcaligenaceae bacterium SAGV3]MPT57909.1 hypothetical protein [Alcaligenaceae bacterium]
MNYIHVALPQYGPDMPAAPSTIEHLNVKIAADEATEFAAIKRFIELMGTCDDLLLTVLKGHLLIEEQLARTIRSGVALGEAYLDGAPRPQFATKASLARALIGNNLPAAFWKCIQSLNDFRNELAHKLEPGNIDGKLDSFITTAENFQNNASRTYQFPNAEGGAEPTEIAMVKSSLALLWLTLDIQADALCETLDAPLTARRVPSNGKPRI